MEVKEALQVRFEQGQKKTYSKIFQPEVWIFQFVLSISDEVDTIFLHQTKVFFLFLGMKMDESNADIWLIMKMGERNVG